MLRVLGGFSLLVLFGILIWSLLFFVSWSFYVLGCILFVASLLWIHKAVSELGLKSVRGQFYVIMAFAFLFQGVGFFFSRLKAGIDLSLVGLVLYVLARLLFFVGNLRYVAYFQSLGYSLNLTRGFVVVALTVVLGVIAFFFPGVKDTFSALSPYMLFIVLDLAMAFLIFYNLLLLWGSEIAKKWAMGSLAIGVYLVADALLIGGFDPKLTIFLWSFAATVMGLVGVIRG
ncbi:MAG: hypothetical protein GXO39_08475 [Thermotogae bacterium]|nr:hypothetical protein [Thermotogota bacterium]